jgi:hypothetical protein
MIRVEKNSLNPFVMLNKEFLNNPALSLKAKGLLSYLLSKPDDWQIYTIELQKHFTDGKSSITTAIKELIKKGYIKRTQSRENGKFGSYEYIVYERIPTENRFSDFGISGSGKQDTTNNDLTNKEITNELKEYNKTPIFDKIGVTFSPFVSELIKYYLKSYEHYTEYKHPYLKYEQLLEIAERLDIYVKDSLDDLEYWSELIHQYFTTFKGNKGTDYNLNHFSFGDTIKILMGRCI